MKCVFHLSTARSDVVHKVLGNIENFFEEEPEAEIALVVNTSAVRLFKKEDSKHRNKIEELQNKGARFKACSNSIEAASGIEEQDIMDEVEIASSAVVELTRLQNNGYAYIRP